jgi:hypothetical protein
VRRLLTALLLMVLSAAPCLALAAAATDKDKESTYHVEVLVFATRLPQLDGDELWTQDQAGNSASALAEAEAPGPAAPVNNLSAAANDLARDGRFRILGYFSWTQTADAKSASKPVRLRGTNPKNPDELDGSMRLYLSRYLHLDLNLGYREDARDAKPAGAGGDNSGKISYRISEQRRVKSQETHYFDHPKFGALVRLTPVMPEK